MQQSIKFVILLSLTRYKYTARSKMLSDCCIVLGFFMSRQSGPLHRVLVFSALLSFFGYRLPLLSDTYRRATKHLPWLLIRVKRVHSRISHSVGAVPSPTTHDQVKFKNREIPIREGSLSLF